MYKSHYYDIVESFKVEIALQMEDGELVQLRLDCAGRDVEIEIPRGIERHGVQFGRDLVAHVVRIGRRYL